MLGEAIGDLLPSAVGVALSPVPIVAVILMLGTPRARTVGSAFALGWITGLVAVSLIVLLVAGGADDADSGAGTAVDLLKLLLGLAFLVMAAVQWRRRPESGEEAEMPGWMAAIDRFAPGKAAAFGILLSGANPKNLALTLAVAASIAQAGLSTGGDAVAVGVFVVIGSLTVAGPVLVFMVASAAARPLASVKQFMSGHNAAIMAVVLLLLGAKLVGNGLAGLSA